MALTSEATSLVPLGNSNRRLLGGEQASGSTVSVAGVSTGGSVDELLTEDDLALRSQGLWMLLDDGDRVPSRL